MSSDIVQCIYTSRAKQALSAKQLGVLLIKARTYNDAREISGMLLYHEGYFFQVIEGAAQEVELLIEKIKKDPRHDSIKMLFYDAVPEREFDKWSMGFVDTAHLLDNTEGFIDYATQIMTLTVDKTPAKKTLKMFHDGIWRG